MIHEKFQFGDYLQAYHGMDNNTCEFSNDCSYTWPFGNTQGGFFYTWPNNLGTYTLILRNCCSNAKLSSNRLKDGLVFTLHDGTQMILDIFNPMNDTFDGADYAYQPSNTLSVDTKLTGVVSLSVSSSYSTDHDWNIKNAIVDTSNESTSERKSDCENELVDSNCKNGSTDWIHNGESSKLSESNELDESNKLLHSNESTDLNTRSAQISGRQDKISDPVTTNTNNVSSNQNEIQLHVVWQPGLWPVVRSTHNNLALWTDSTRQLIPNVFLFLVVRKWQPIKIWRIYW